ncbi:MAG TPA: hypothetical protein PK250_11720 [Syntrophobacter fumaroxidans]|nr:hypothetical protein [Syntrophobacter fumaroxidans]
MKTLLMLFMCLSVFPVGAPGAAEVIPPMKECMAAHGSQQEYLAVLKKYADPGIIRQAMGLLVIKNPSVMQTETRGSSVCYTVEGILVETSSEIPSDTTQVYRACWDNGRIVSLEFFGPKSRPTGEIIPEMRECMQSHDSREKYAAVIAKYADPGLIRRAMALLVIKEPSVIRVERDGAVIIYTVQGRTVGTSNEIPADTVQVYRVAWKGGRIISLEFLGAAGAGR